MSKNENSAVATPVGRGYELRITRVFDAPRELVWKAWTDPDMAKQWMGPRGFQATEFTAPAEVGSPWRMVMEGHVPATDALAHLAQGGRTLELVPPEKLVYTFAWEERAGVGLSPSPYKENIVSVLFEERGDKTVMTFTQAPFATEGERDGHTGGWNSSFDRFAEFLLAQQPQRKVDPDEALTELHTRRFFAAARETVFEAWTKPELLAQWWGPERFTNPVCEVDARAGGEIYVEMKAPDGKLYPMSGRFLEVYPPFRFHFTSSALDDRKKPIFEVWNSVYFAEVKGGTEITLDVHVTAQTAEAPQYLKSMSMGWKMSLDKLERLMEERV